MNQNLFRLFLYMSSSSFFNAVSVSGYVIRETGHLPKCDSASFAGFHGRCRFSRGRAMGQDCPYPTWLGL